MPDVARVELVRELARRLPDGFTVVADRAEAGELDVADASGFVHHLHLPARVLDKVLKDDQAALDVWGPGVPTAESAARFLSIHLEESLATRDPGPGADWTYDDGFFDPVPPRREWKFW